MNPHIESRTARLTPRERLIAALKGEIPDQIPFSCYHSIVPKSEIVRRELFELGLVSLNRLHPFKFRYRNVEFTQEDKTENGEPVRVKTFKTPLGVIWQKNVFDPGYHSEWPVKHYVTKPEDYDVLEYVFRDEYYEPDVEGFLAADREYGPNSLAIPRAADPPYQELWRRFTGLDRFCFDLSDHPGKIERIIEAMNDRRRRMWEVAAAMPCEFSCSGGNISEDMVSPAVFRKYVATHLAEEASVMHKAGKRTMNHMDGRLRILLDAIGEADLDIVEAFTPPPNGNLSVKDARGRWRGKVLSINFPSSVHLADNHTIRETTISLLQEAAHGNGFVVGITEDVPAFVIERSFRTIAETLNEV